MILLDPSEDRFHNLEFPGSYEWTYFDGLSEDGELGFSAIWFRGIPMSPWYSAAIDRNPQNALPERYCAFAFGLYSRSGRIASALEEGPESLFSGDTTSPDVRFRENGLYASPTGSKNGGDTGYRMVLDIRRPLLASRIQGEITFQFPVHDLSGAAAPYTPAGSAAPTLSAAVEKHFWVPAAPNGSFNAAIDITALGRSAARYRFRGRAYHDRNFGLEPLHYLNVDWHWGRVHFGTKAFVFFDISPRTDTIGGERLQKREGEPFRRFLLFDGGRLVECSQDVIFSPARRRNHWATLPYPTHVGGSSAAAQTRFSAGTRSLLDSGPFYHRIAADFEVERQGVRQAALGMTEYLRPTRLGFRIFRPFVKFRVRRVGGVR